MIEYSTKAIVLGRYPRGELDGNVSLYTKEAGRVSAFAKSIRKPTSKLAGHLLAGSIGTVRIVEKNTLQVIDALASRQSNVSLEMLVFLSFIEQMTPQGEADLPFWYAVEEMVRTSHIGPESYEYLLGVLGFGGGAEVCAVCGVGAVARFSPKDIMFVCTLCFGKVTPGADDWVYVQ